MAAIVPATAIIPHTSAIAPIAITALGKSKNRGWAASTDLTDMAGGRGAIGEGAKLDRCARHTSSRIAIE